MISRAERLAWACAAVAVLASLGASRAPRFAPAGPWADLPGPWIREGAAEEARCTGACVLSQRIDLPQRSLVRASVAVEATGDGLRWFARTGPERSATGLGPPGPERHTQSGNRAGLGPLPQTPPGGALRFSLDPPSTVRDFERTWVQVTVVAGPGPTEVGLRALGDARATLRSAEVAPARRDPWAAALLALALASWAGAALLAAPRLPRSLIALGLLGIAGVMLPGELLTAALSALPGARPEDLGVDPWVRPTVPGLVHKGGHLLEFALLAFVGRREGGAPRVVLARCVAFALATEALQLLLSSRSARPIDVGIDTLGAVLGLLAAAALRAPARGR